MSVFEAVGAFFFRASIPFAKKLREEYLNKDCAFLSMVFSYKGKD